MEITEIRKDHWAKYHILEDRIVNVPKMYYGKYLYRVEFAIPGAWMFRQRITKANFVKALSSDAEKERQRWGLYLKYHALTPDEQNFNFDKIYNLLTELKTCDKKSTRIRVEGVRLRLFAKSAGDITKVLDAVPGSEKYVSTIEQPASLAIANLLSEGTIYLKSPPKYKYRVTIRSKRYPPDLRKSIVGYIDNHKDEIFLTSNMSWYLREQKSYLLEGYFHVNDLSVLTFLAMIAPSFVSKVNALALATDINSTTEE